MSIEAFTHDQKRQLTDAMQWVNTNKNGGWIGFGTRNWTSAEWNYGRYDNSKTIYSLRDMGVVEIKEEHGKEGSYHFLYFRILPNKILQMLFQLSDHPFEKVAHE